MGECITLINQELMSTKHTSVVCILYGKYSLIQSKAQYTDRQHSPIHSPICIQTAALYQISLR